MIFKKLVAWTSLKSSTKEKRNLYDFDNDYEDERPPAYVIIPFGWAFTLLWNWVRGRR